MLDFFQVLIHLTHIHLLKNSQFYMKRVKKNSQAQRFTRMVNIAETGRTTYFVNRSLHASSRTRIQFIEPSVMLSRRKINAATPANVPRKDMFMQSVSPFVYPRYFEFLKYFFNRKFIQNEEFATTNHYPYNLRRKKYYLVLDPRAKRMRRRDRFTNLIKIILRLI